MNGIEFYENISPDYFPIKINGRYERGYSYMPHWHEQLEIQHVFSGTAILRCADELYYLREGDTAVINGGVLHECVTGYGRYGCIIVSSELLGNEKIDFKVAVRDEAITDLINKIYVASENEEIGSLQEIKGYTYLLLSKLMKAFSKTETESLSANEEKIRPCIEYINSHFGENISADDLSAAIHVSKGYVSRLFSEIKGETPNKYIKNVRLKKAAKMLEETDMNITEVALKCGFDDSNYFARVFKRKFGKSPRSYRAELIRKK